MPSRTRTGNLTVIDAPRPLLAVVACVALVSPACRDAGRETGEVTRTSIESYEQGVRQLEAGDVAAARASFAAAVEAGGLQPDLYCEARFRQAKCEAELGNHDAAIAMLEELARGAPDVDRINEELESIRARRAGKPAQAPASR